jgi:hypothetical protein
MVRRSFLESRMSLDRRAVLSPPLFAVPLTAAGRDREVRVKMVTEKGTIVIAFIRIARRSPWPTSWPMPTRG